MLQSTTHQRRNRSRSAIALATPFCAIIISVCITFTSVSGQSCDPAVDPVIGLPGIHGYGWEMEVFDDGSGSSLYLAGSFDTAGGKPISGIARWDGREFSDVGGSLTAGGAVYSLFVFDDGLGSGPALYAGGNFDEIGGVAAQNVAKWDGTTWSPLSEGVDDIVYSFESFDDGRGPALYVGGRFDLAGGTPARRIARWDGSGWEPLGAGLLGGNIWGVLALEVFDDGTGPALYAGGDFLLEYPNEGYWLAR